MSKPAFPPIFDGHNDTILSLLLPDRGKNRTFFQRSEHGHIDLPRAQEGGLGGGFFAVFVPSKKRTDPRKIMEQTTDGYRIPLPDPLKHDYAQNFAMRALARLMALEEEANGAVRIVRSADDLQSTLDQGAFAMLLHFEGAEPIDTDLNALHVFHAAGLRSLGLVWSRPNAFATGVPFNFPDSPDIGPGLTDAGKALVRECNKLKIMVDLSHLNEQGFWDVAEISHAPLVATHSCAYALAKSPRNLTDRQLDAVRDSGGVVGVNYHIGFLREDGRSDLETSVSEIVRHVDYMVERMGIDHVALGSDFDGATMPHDLRDAAGLPKLVTALRAAGYDDDALTKIAHGNWVRVLRTTWGG